jgi:predicted nucleic acid-binding protein
VPNGVEKLRVAIDTNVWISGQLTIAGVAAELTRLVIQLTH